MAASPFIGAVIPARSASERLRAKHLADLGGAPVIVRMLERLASSKFLSLDRIVVCTTESPEDDRLAETVRNAGSAVFRGDADDLIRRLGEAVSEHGFDIVVEADGDDPFIEVAYAGRAVQRLIEHEEIDVVLPPQLPLGLAAKVVRGRAFETVRSHYRTGRNDTGFMYYFTRSGLFRVETLAAADDGHVRPEIRLTLDYEDDLTVMREVFAELGGDRAFGVGEIVELFERRPELAAINGHLSDEYWDRTRALVDLQFEFQGKLYAIQESSGVVELPGGTGQGETTP